MSDDAYALGARFGNPCLTLAAEHLTHVGVFPITWKALELLGCRIKAHDGIGCPLREPHIETNARVPTPFEVAGQPLPASETTERADFSTSGLQAVPLQQLDDEQIAALIKVGRELIADTKILIARLVLQRAAKAGSAPAALELGRTYDPIILERLGLTANTEMVESTVIFPDTALARAWYQKAKELGSVDAPGRLEKLARHSGRPR